MSLESVSAAQSCRSHCQITRDLHAKVIAYVDGNEYDVTVSYESNKITFDFGLPIEGYQYFDTNFQDMEWIEDDGILIISNQKPNYSFSAYFPKS